MGHYHIAIINQVGAKPPHVFIGFYVVIRHFFDQFD
jgi:hypothetical protein